MNSITRGPVSVLVYLPKLPEISISGTALKMSNRTEFVTLKTSQEKSRCWRSVILKVFRSDESTLK